MLVLMIYLLGYSHEEEGKHFYIIYRKMSFKRPLKTREWTPDMGCPFCLIHLKYNLVQNLNNQRESIAVQSGGSH